MSEIISPASSVSVVTNIDGITQDVPMIVAAGAGSLPVYATGEAAHAVCPKDGSHVIIRAKKNSSKGSDTSDGWQVFTVIKGFGAEVGSLGSWAEVVNNVLLAQASESLKAWRVNNPLATSVPASMFTAAQLREDFLAGGSGLSMDKETLEKLFCASATYQAFINSDKYKFNAQYRTLVDIFKGKIVALASRSQASITDSDLDTIIVKIHEDDLQSQFGAYVIARIAQIKKKREDEETEVDLAAL